MTGKQQTETMKKRIENLGETVTETGRNLWFAGLGLVSAMDENVRATFTDLVQRGERYSEGDNLVGKGVKQVGETVRTTQRKVTEGFQQVTTQALHGVGLPTHDEIRTLIERVEKLTKRVEALQ